MSQWAEVRQMHVVDGVPKKQIAEARVAGIGPRGSPGTTRSDGQGPAGELIADGRLDSPGAPDRCSRN